jgi:hypothetical protein
MTYQIVLTPALEVENLATAKALAIERGETSARTLQEELRHRHINVYLVVVVVSLRGGPHRCGSGDCHDFKKWVHEPAWKACELTIIAVSEVLKQF